MRRKTILHKGSDGVNRLSVPEETRHHSLLGRMAPEGFYGIVKNNGAPKKNLYFY